MGRRQRRTTALIAQPEGPGTPFAIVRDDAIGAEMAALIELHLADVGADTAAEYRFALDLEALRAPDISLWGLWQGPTLIGCAALKDLGNGEGEVKSMRTHPDHLRKGTAARLLSHLIGDATARGWSRLNLETGTSALFVPAHALYHRFGFVDCGPYADYTESPHNRFMTLALPRKA